MQRPPTPWGYATMLVLSTFLCLLTKSHANPIESSKSTHGLTTQKQKSRHNAKTNKSYAAKRSSVGGSYHKGVPEHFVMAEHGPEIHLDIDEHGTVVDTHPASLHLDTATDAHEHCCRHCHHHECHHVHCCAGKKRSFGGHHDRHVHVVKYMPNNDCYGGVCRSNIVDYTHLLQPQPYQMPVRDPNGPGHIVYDVPQGSQPFPTQMMEARINNDHREGYGRIAYDPRVDHRTGETRGSIEKYRPPDMNYIQLQPQPYQLPGRSVGEPAHIVYNAAGGSQGLATHTMEARLNDDNGEGFWRARDASPPASIVYNVEGSNQGLATHMTEARVNDDHRDGLRRVTYDSHVEHKTGETRGTIGKYIPTENHQLVGNNLPVHTSTGEGASKLITYDRTSGLALKDGHVPMTPEEIALKRSNVNIGKIRS